MKWRVGVALIGATASAGTLAVVLLTTAEEDKPAGQPVWAACPADVAVPPLVLTPVQCATIKVPLDYSDPDGTGLDQPAFMVSKGLPSSVLDAYDLIGMDTRGVGYSSKVSCGFLVGDIYYGNIPSYAVDDAAVTTQAGLAQEVANRCAANDSDGRLRHLTTANTARDLLRIRIALGEPRGRFYGASYGSALGAAYASMFPETPDRVVLDSDVGDTHVDQAGIRRYGLGFEEAFTDFAKWAADRNDSYGLSRTPEQVHRRFMATAARLDKTPAEPPRPGYPVRRWQAAAGEVRQAFEAGHRGRQR